MFSQENRQKSDQKNKNFQKKSEPFAKTPKYLFDDSRYGLLSNDAKLLYTLLLDRHSLSCKNKDVFSDERGVYILFTRENMAQTLHCSRQKAGRLVAELTLAGLVREKRMGLNKANRIYVNTVSEEKKNEKLNPAPSPATYCNPKEHLDVTITNHQDGSSCTVNNTKKINTDIYYNTPPAPYCEEPSIVSSYKERSDRKSEVPHCKASTERQTYLKTMEEIKEQIDFDNVFEQADALTLQAVEAILQIMIEVYTSDKLTLRVRGQNMGIDFIRWQYKKLNSDHIEYVIEALQNNSTAIRDIRAYLRTALFNAPETIGIYYNSALNTCP